MCSNTETIKILERFSCIQLTFGGTGSALCDARLNSNNNAVLWTEKGPLVIDCGGTMPYELIALNLPFEAIAGILLTHIHGDHVNGIEHIAWMRYFGGKVPKHFKTHIYSAPDVLERLRKYLEPSMQWYTQDADGKYRLVKYEEIFVHHPLSIYPDLSLDFGGFQFKYFRVYHGTGEKVDKPAYGFQIFRKSLEIVFSGDSEFRSNIHKRFPDSKLIFHDCMMYPSYKGTVHAHYPDMKEFLSENDRNRTYIMGTNCIPKDEMLKNDGFRGVAKRGQTFIITDKVVETGTFRSAEEITPPPAINWSEINPKDELTLISTGTSFQSTLPYLDNGYIINTPLGFVLVNCGVFMPQSLLELGISLHDLYCIVITDLKSTHTSGIEQAMWTRHYSPPTSTKSKLHPESKGIYLITRIYCPKNTKQLLEEKLVPIVEGYTDRNGDVRPVEINEIFDIVETDEFDIDCYNFKYINNNININNNNNNNENGGDGFKPIIKGEGEWKYIGLNVKVNNHNYVLTVGGTEYNEEYYKSMDNADYFILHPVFKNEYVNGIYDEKTVEQINNSSLRSKYVIISNPTFKYMPSGSKLPKVIPYGKLLRFKDGEFLTEL